MAVSRCGRFAGPTRQIARANTDRLGCRSGRPACTKLRREACSPRGTPLSGCDLPICPLLPQTFDRGLPALRAAVRNISKLRDPLHPAVTSGGETFKGQQCSRTDSCGSSIADWIVRLNSDTTLWLPGLADEVLPAYSPAPIRKCRDVAVSPAF